MLDHLTKETFAPHKGSTFHIRLNAQETVPVELVEITEFPDYEGTRRAPFSLVFRGTHRFILPQQIYTIEHATMEPLQIFLVTIGPDPQGMRYEAVFN